MKLVISILTAATAMAGAAFAETGKAGEVYGAWKVACEPKAPCQAFLGLQDPASGKLILSASAHKAAADKSPALVLTLPLGVSLREGVALLPGAADKAPIPAVVDVCFPDGCRVVLEMTPATLSALSAGEFFEVRFVAHGAADRVESVRVPANGLKDAIARISRD